jgi:transposase-like protein
MDQTDAQQRAKWVERWKDSGLTAKEFAAEAGLTASALYNWSSQLAAAKRKQADRGSELAVQPMRSERACRAKTPPATPTPHFVELPIAAVSQSPVMLELLFGDVCVRVPSGFDEVTLTRVVRALGVAR